MDFNKLQTHLNDDIRVFDDLLAMDVTQRQRKLLIQHKSYLKSLLRNVNNLIGNQEILDLSKIKKPTSSQKKKELYDAGLSDAEICAALDISRQCLQAWRKRHNLPPNEKKSNHFHETYQTLYDQGLGDTLIAAQTKTPIVHVVRWRKETNRPSVREQRTDKALQMFQAGKTIADVAFELEAAYQTASRWYHSFLRDGKIVRNRAGVKKIDRDKVRALTDAGMSVSDIARELKTWPSTVWSILREFRRESA